MLKIVANDSSNQEYYQRLVKLVTEDEELTSITETVERLPRLPITKIKEESVVYGKDETDYILNVAVGAKPRKAANHIAHVIKQLINQPDWGCIYLDDTFEVSADIWDSFPSYRSNEGEIKLSLGHDRPTQYPAKSRTFIVRGVKNCDERGTHGFLNTALFTQSCVDKHDKHKKYKKIKTLPFSYYIAAVVITLMLCYLWHNSSKFNRFRR